MGIEYTLNNTLSSKDYFLNHGIAPKDGFIPTAKEAVQIAEIVLNIVYGKGHIEKQKPFSVNLENDVWIIEGHLTQDMDGGVVYMEIRKNNGEILKVLHGK